MSAARLAIVAGAGAGLGQALLHHFQDQGMIAVGLARSPDPDLIDLDIRACDVSDNEDTAPLLADLIRDHGPPRIVVHNPASLVIQPFLDTAPHEFETCWRAMVLSATVLARATLQPMVRGGGGAFVVSGATASLRGSARFAAFASAKFALRGLTQSLAREFQPAGVHVVHTILDGIIDTPKSRAMHAVDPSRMIDPADIAQAYWHLAHQPRSAWSHEVDLRPYSESF